MTDDLNTQIDSTLDDSAAAESIDPSEVGAVLKAIVAAIPEDSSLSDAQIAAIARIPNAAEIARLAGLPTFALWLDGGNLAWQDRVYAVRAVVAHNGAGYVCIQTTQGQARAVTEPGAGSDWETYWAVLWSPATSGGTTDATARSIATTADAKAERNAGSIALLEALVGEGSLIREEFSGNLPATDGERVGTIDFANSRNVGYVITVGTGTVFDLSSQWRAKRANTAVDIGGAQFFSNSSGHLLVNSGSGKSAKIWVVRDVAAIQAAVAAARTGAEVPAPAAGDIGRVARVGGSASDPSIFFDMPSDIVLDAILPRSNADRGKALGLSASDRNALAFLTLDNLFSRGVRVHTDTDNAVELAAADVGKVHVVVGGIGGQDVYLDSHGSSFVAQGDTYAILKSDDLAGEVLVQDNDTDENVVATLVREGHGVILVWSGSSWITVAEVNSIGEIMDAVARKAVAGVRAYVDRINEVVSELETDETPDWANVTQDQINAGYRFGFQDATSDAITSYEGVAWDTLPRGLSFNAGNFNFFIEVPKGVSPLRSRIVQSRGNSEVATLPGDGQIWSPVALTDTPDSVETFRLSVESDGSAVAAAFALSDIAVLQIASVSHDLTVTKDVEGLRQDVLAVQHLARQNADILSLFENETDTPTEWNAVSHADRFMAAGWGVRALNAAWINGELPTNEGDFDHGVWSSFIAEEDDGKYPILRAPAGAIVDENTVRFDKTGPKPTPQAERPHVAYIPEGVTDGWFRFASTESYDAYGLVRTLDDAPATIDLSGLGQRADLQIATIVHDVELDGSKVKADSLPSSALDAGTDDKKMAFRDAIGITPENIGDAAFSNPPNDLTDDEETAAREAIGAASVDEGARATAAYDRVFGGRLFAYGGEGTGNNLQFIRFDDYHNSDRGTLTDQGSPAPVRGQGESRDRIVVGIAAHPLTGEIFVTTIDGGASFLQKLDPATGALERVGNANRYGIADLDATRLGAFDPGGLAFHPDGSVCRMVGVSRSLTQTFTSIFTLNVETGAVISEQHKHVIPNVFGPVFYRDIATEADGVSYVTDGDNFYRVNTTSGVRFRLQTGLNPDILSMTYDHHSDRIIGLGADEHLYESTSDGSFARVNSTGSTGISEALKYHLMVAPILPYTSFEPTPPAEPGRYDLHVGANGTRTWSPVLEPHSEILFFDSILTDAIVQGNFVNATPRASNPAYSDFPTPGGDIQFFSNVNRTTKTFDLRRGIYDFGVAGQGNPSGNTGAIRCEVWGSAPDGQGGFASAALLGWTGTNVLANSGDWQDFALTGLLRVPATGTRCSLRLIAERRNIFVRVASDFPFPNWGMFLVDH